MLTADLLDYRRRSGGVVPRLLDPAAPHLHTAAAELIALVQAHLGRPRGELEDALRAADFPRVGAKAAAGLARLLLERCTFEVAAAADPVALREAAFSAGAAAWSGEGAGGEASGGEGTGEPGTPPWRTAVLGRAVAPLGLTVESADAALFADLEENQRLLESEPIAPEALLYRYNVAQVQGLLLRAESVSLSAPWPPPRRLRQLMRYLKFYGLLFREEPAPAAGRKGAAPALTLVVDGPLSVLESSTRYGLNLAQFFPALLLWEEPWTLEATLRLGKGRTRAHLRLQPHPWLRSHYPDHGQWVPAEVERFVAAFNEARGAAPGRWHAAPAEALLPLPDNRSLVPDFEFRRTGSAGGSGAPEAPVYLEHLPYPDAQAVTARLERIAAAGRTDYLLACRATPAVKALGEHPALVTFRRSLLPGIVRKALDERKP